jgi:N-acetylmuramoyl-L-alanine amidase
MLKQLYVTLVCLTVIALSAPAHADSFLITDFSGAPLGRLPYITRGDEALVPLALLARKAGWTVTMDDASYVVLALNQNVTLRRGNPFAEINEQYLQMRVPPEEWDGSLWLASSALEDLFGAGIQKDRTTGSIRIQSMTPVTPEPALPEGTPAAKGGSDAKPAAWALKNVIIDAGHGGKDPGATGLYGLNEKTLTLDIAKRLATLLKERGVPCTLTREGDEFLELHERTAKANEHKGDLLVSIHCNSFKDPNIRGLETYFLKPAKSERAVEAALRENSVVQLETDASKYQDMTEENYILLSMATAQYMKDSETWAGSSLSLLREKTGIEGRQVDQAGFYVLMGASMPAVLVECGYLTNPDDAKFLASERGRSKIAEALAESITKTKLTMESAASR